MLSVRHRSVHRSVLGRRCSGSLATGSTCWLYVLAVSASLAATACGGGDTDAMKKRVTTLQDEVTLLQNDVDRLEERLAAVESRPLVQSSAEDRKGAAAGTLERPRLKVIKLEPGPSPAAAGQTPDEPAADVKDTDEPRPMIRGTGDHIESELPRAGGGRDHG